MICNQTRCETRRRSEPIVALCRLGTRQEKWKLRVQQCGLHCGDDELLTNVRYADDLTLYARIDIDLTTMVECLVEELATAAIVRPMWNTSDQRCGLGRENSRQNSKASPS